MARPIPNEGTTTFEEELWTAWRAVLEDGFQDFKLGAAIPLARAFDVDERDREGLKRHMLAVLAGRPTEDEVRLENEFERLEAEAKARLTLWRADPEPAPTADEARQRVIDQLRDVDETFDKGLGAFRSGRNGEWKLLSGVLMYTLARSKHLGGAGKLRRSSGIAIRTAMETVVYDRGCGDCEFWDRPSTTSYLQRIATLGALTIVAGADGSSDQGEPVHRDLYATAARRRLSRGTSVSILRLSAQRWKTSSRRRPQTISAPS